MRTIAAVCLLFCLSVSSAVVARAQQADDAAPASLRVYVHPVQGHDEELNRQIRSDLVDSLNRRGLRIVSAAEEADVVLTCTGLLKSARNSNYKSHRPDWHIRGLLRLTRTDGVTLWNGDVSSSHFALSQKSSFVDAAMDKISRALQEESKRRAAQPAVKAA